MKQRCTFFLHKNTVPLGSLCQRSRDTSNDIWMTVLHLLFSDAVWFFNCFIHGFDDFQNNNFMKLITNTTVWNSWTFRYGKPSIALMNVYSDDHCWSSLKRAIKFCCAEALFLKRESSGNYELCKILIQQLMIYHVTSSLLLIRRGKKCWLIKCFRRVSKELVSD